MENTAHTNQPNKTEKNLVSSPAQSPVESLNFLNKGRIEPEQYTPEQVIMLQRQFGNQATQKIMSGQPITHSISREFLQRDPESKAKSEPRKKMGPITTIVSDDVSLMQEASASYQEQATKILNNLASAAGGELIMGPIKAVDRIMEKAIKKIKGEGGKKKVSAMAVTSDIKDVLRATIMFDDFNMLSSGYQNVVKELNIYKRSGGIVTGISKMESGFGEGAEQSSGYRDAKLIFRVEPSADAKKTLSRMMGSLPELSIEVQFNTKAALVVKDGKLPGKESDASWDFQIEGGPTGEQFDALAFLEKLQTDTVTDSKFDALRADIETFKSTHNAILTGGIPIAHELYESKKLRKFAKAEGITTDEVNAKYNPLYKDIYSFAYRYSKYKSTTGAALDASVKKLKGKHVS